MEVDIRNHSKITVEHRGGSDLLKRREKFEAPSPIAGRSLLFSLSLFLSLTHS